VPTELILSIAFLYAMLGPSALLGLTVMVVLSPVPALISAWMARLQAAKMVAVSRRVILCVLLMATLT
jgi:hypothetical protein